MKWNTTTAHFGRLALLVATRGIRLGDFSAMTGVGRALSVLSSLLDDRDHMGGVLYKYSSRVYYNFLGVNIEKYAVGCTTDTNLGQATTTISVRASLSLGRSPAHVARK
jgi:hypothetical protein